MASLEDRIKNIEVQSARNASSIATQKPTVESLVQQGLSRDQALAEMVLGKKKREDFEEKSVKELTRIRQGEVDAQRPTQDVTLASLFPQAVKNTPSLQGINFIRGLLGQPKENSKAAPADPRLADIAKFEQDAKKQNVEQAVIDQNRKARLETIAIEELEAIGLEVNPRSIAAAMKQLEEQL